MNILLRPATVTYCEGSTNNLISRPGYALSNIPYILVGIYIIYKHRDSKFSIIFGLLSIIIGLFSFLYDATASYFFQYFDWIGLFLFVLYLSLINIQRLFKFSTKSLLILSPIIFLIYLIFSYLSEHGYLAFAVGVIFVVLSEFYLAIRTKKKVSKEWVYALILFIVGFSLRTLDLYKIFCDPTNIFNGRGIFHYLTAISVVLLHDHYKKVYVKISS